MRWMICLMLCMFCSTNSSHAEETVEQTPEQALEPVLKQLRVNDLSRVFAEMSILRQSQLSSDEIDELMLKSKKSRQSFGISLGEIKLIETKRVGSRVVQLTYIEYLERHPLIWRFTMYRASNQWRIINASWNHELNDLLEKSKPVALKPENTKR
jgi:hypothetical protein